MRALSSGPRANSSFLRAVERAAVVRVLADARFAVIGPWALRAGGHWRVMYRAERRARLLRRLGRRRLHWRGADRAQPVDHRAQAVGLAFDFDGHAKSVDLARDRKLGCRLGLLVADAGYVGIRIGHTEVSLSVRRRWPVGYRARFRSAAYRGGSYRSGLPKRPRDARSARLGSKDSRFRRLSFGGWTGPRRRPGRRPRAPPLLPSDPGCEPRNDACRAGRLLRPCIGRNR